MLDPMRAAGLDLPPDDHRPAGPWQASLTIALSAGIGAFALYEALIVRIGGLPIYLWLSAGVGCLILVVALLWARDIRSWRTTAAVQVLLGCIVGGLAWFVSGDAAGKWGGFIGAVVVVADGLKGFRNPMLRQAKADDK
jgi:hypothetical protein